MISAITNHLLQSTVFAVAAGMVTLCLRNNHARTRYWIWLVASLKFLVPFSLFVEVGHWLSWSTAPTISQPQLVFVIDQIAQPFVAPDFFVATAAPVASTAVPSIVPTLLLAMWICGFAAVLIFWFVRWRRVAVMLRTGTPVGEGRELRALRRFDTSRRLISSPAQIEPGVFGIVRPVLSLPAGIAKHLDDAQLDAILAHELCHIRRRDNLTSALHMLVEAVFWFHPLVWWIGAKLVEERERACDEEVVRLGSDPEIYAESILKICRIYLGSPLICAAGISGSDLRKRIESIIRNSLIDNLSVGKKLLIGVAGFLVLITPIMAGILSASAGRVHLQIPALVLAPPQAPVPQLIAQAAPAPAQNRAIVHAQPVPAFEAASVKPHDFPKGVFGFHNSGGNPIRISGTRVTVTTVTLETLVREAYDVRDFQVTGAPGWTGNNGRDQFYDIEARTPGDAPPTTPEVRQMLQTLVADRFQLKFHREPKDAPVYDLVLGKDGPKLKATTPASKPPDNPFTQSGNDWRVSFTNKSSTDLVAFLGPNVDRPVVDKTALAGNYDFTLEFTHSNPDVASASPDADRSIFSAVQEQLGLKLVSAKEPVEIIVIDHAERPSGN